jgi:hypothetical protein
MARREVDAQLVTIAQRAPSQAVAAYRSVLSAIQGDPNLAPYAAVIPTRIDQALVLWAEADLQAARAAFDSGDASRAIEICERLVGNISTIGNERSRQARAAADTLVAAVVPLRGVRLGSIQGHYTLGTADSYASILQGQVAAALRQRGYVVRPPATFWGPLWDQQAPFQMTVKLSERYVAVYPQTNDRMTTIDARLALEQKAKPRPIWEATVFLRSRYPNPELRKIATGKRAREYGLRNPESELVLYRDARAPLAQSLAKQLETLPVIRTPLALTPARTGSS